MPYVDGYLIPIPKKNIAAYKRIAQQAAKLWRDHGALEYRECVGDDLNPQWGTPFPKTMSLKAGETIVFSWIVFKSRGHRDRVNASVMKDPRMNKMMEKMKKSKPIFDHHRMNYAGFEVLVDA